MYPQEDDAKLAASSANAEPEWSVPCYHSKHERGADAPQPAVALGHPDNRSIRNCADWRCPMPEAAYSSNMTEAVAVFHDVKTFQAAIDELLLAGFDHADINVLAQEDTIASKLGPTYASTAEFEDDPEAPRIAYIPNETIGNAEGAVIGAGFYVPAMFGSLAVAASGGTLLGVFAAAALAGGAGGLIGAALARFIGHEHAKHLDQHLQHGGLLLWVRTRDADCEQRALEILRRHSARDVHLHQIPERACKESDVPRERPRVVHLLDREYSFDFLGRPPQP